MARSRNIKPGFFKNEDLSDVQRDGRLLFIGLWTLCDCRGVVEDRPKRIRVEIFPYDDITVKQIDKHLSDLQKFGFLERYKSDGISLIFIPKFKKHQSPHPGEKKNGFKLPSEVKNKDSYEKTKTKSKLLSEDISEEKSVTSKRQEGACKGGQQDMNHESLIMKDESCIMNHDSGSPLPDDDPNFQSLKYTTNDLMDVCLLATTRYKSTQYPSEVQPYVHNLLAQIDKETLSKAITNVSDNFDSSNRPHDKRPDFHNKFKTVEMIKEFAQTPKIPSDVTAETGNIKMFPEITLSEVEKKAAE